MPHLILGAVDLTGVVMTIVGLGFLIFFHELGHFLACRVTGTRVEAFSIGFGPKLVGWRRGKTLYKISAIPLGGYVKMAAENPGDKNTGAPDEFPNKPFGARLLIMSAGVVFNIVLGFVLYAWAFGIGVPLKSTEIGDVAWGEAAWEAGVRPGDRVLALDGDEVVSFEDLHLAVAFSDEGETVTLTVERDGETLKIPVRPRYSEANGMPLIGVAPAADVRESRVESGSPVERAGGRPGDEILAANGHPVDGPRNLESLLQDAVRRAGDVDEVSLTLKVRHASGEEAELHLSLSTRKSYQLGIMPFRGRVIDRVARGSPAEGLVRPGDVLVSVDEHRILDLGILANDLPGDESITRVEVLRAGEPLALKPAGPLTLRELAEGVFADYQPGTRLAPRPGMPAAAAGLQAGDRVLEVAGIAVSEWTDLQKMVQDAGAKPIRVLVERGDGRHEFTIEPVERVVGVAAFGYATPAAVVLHKETSVSAAMAMGWKRTVTMMKQVLLTVKSLVTRRVSAENIGGPILLAEVTYTMFDLGWGRYLAILALISINLAVLNLLPIPVLDGGQMVLLCAEKLRGKPLPERVVGYLQLVGLVMILGLMLLAFHNDIVRLLK